MFNRTSLHIALLLWGCIFSLIAFVCMIFSNKFSKYRRKLLLFILAACAFLLFCDALAWGFRGKPGRASYWVVTVSNLMVFIMSDVLVALYNGYIWQSFYRDKACDNVPVKRFKAVYAVATVGIVMCIISQFTHFYYYIDSNNVYHRNHGHIVAMIIPITGMLIDATIIMKCRKKISTLMLISALSYMILPLVAAVIQIFFYGISITNIAISISMIMLFITTIIEQNENLARKENEAARLRISIMISQIAPHFIYNTLTSIRELCDVDPVQAGKLTEDFSEYLRCNLESLNMEKPVPFERELKHVKYYVAIEKKRFGDKINVEYDISEVYFLIPALTLQPMVENAIKHGIRRKKGAGTVKITVKRNNDDICITIADDGAGFDIGSISPYDQTHVGIRNVRERLKDMVNGELDIDSMPGTGTIVTIRLPQTNIK